MQPPTLAGLRELELVTKTVQQALMPTASSAAGHQASQDCHIQQQVNRHSSSSSSQQRQLLQNLLVKGEAWLAGEMGLILI
jgi:hypothetical protein